MFITTDGKSIHQGYVGLLAQFLMTFREWCVLKASRKCEVKGRVIMAWARDLKDAGHLRV